MLGTVRSLMNDTKWEELRTGMYELAKLHPRWRTKVLNGQVSRWDGEWFYHFRKGGYKDIEWVDIEIQSPDQDAAVLNLLRKIHVPGHKTEGSYRIYGYCADGIFLDYIC